MYLSEPIRVDFLMVALKVPELKVAVTESVLPEAQTKLLDPTTIFVSYAVSPVESFL